MKIVKRKLKKKMITRCQTFKVAYLMRIHTQKKLQNIIYIIIYWTAVEDLNQNKTTCTSTLNVMCLIQNFLSMLNALVNVLFVCFSYPINLNTTFDVIFFFFFILSWFQFSIIWWIYDVTCIFSHIDFDWNPTFIQPHSQRITDKIK